MQIQPVTLQSFVDAFKVSHGLEGASQLIQETVKKLGLHGRVDFTKEEAIIICRELQSNSGFVAVVAGILLTRFSQCQF